MHISVVPIVIRCLFPAGIIWSVKTSKTIYLTFDDGPVPEVTPLVLDILKEHKAKATFFCVGDNVHKYPELYQQILHEGHATGNHTFSHLNGFNSTNEDYFKDISKCGEYVNSGLFRPPHGRMKLSQLLYLRMKYRIIMWSVLTGDYNHKLSKERVLRNAINYTKDGSIIVFHDSIKASERLLYALPEILKYFSKRGFIFDKLSVDLLQ